MAETNERHDEEFRRTVQAKADRKRRARDRQDDVWFWLGMFGLVGWSVATPTLIGIGLGVWLDRRTDTTDTSVSWTLTLLIVGLAVGCALAWYWIRQESRDE